MAELRQQTAADILVDPTGTGAPDGSDNVRERAHGPGHEVSVNHDGGHPTDATSSAVTPAPNDPVSADGQSQRIGNPSSCEDQRDQRTARAPKKKRGMKPRSKRNRKKPKSNKHGNDTAHLHSRKHLMEIQFEDAPVEAPTKWIRAVEPYPYTFATFAKARWIGRTILDVYSTEFGSYPRSYYCTAIKQGRILVNDNKVDPDYVIRGQDSFSHTIHRHEPGVAVHANTAPYINIAAETDEVVVADKPGTLPIHPCGGYHVQSLMHILEPTFGKLYTIHRLDRLTSGLVIMGKNSAVATEWGKAIMDRQCSKIYLARVTGRFPNNCRSSFPRLTTDDADGDSDARGGAGDRDILGTGHSHGGDTDVDIDSDTQLLPVNGCFVRRAANRDSGNDNSNGDDGNGPTNGAPPAAPLAPDHDARANGNNGGRNQPKSQQKTDKAEKAGTKRARWKETIQRSDVAHGYWCTDGAGRVQKDASFADISKSAWSVDEWLDALRDSSARQTKEMRMIHVAIPTRIVNPKDGVCKAGAFDDVVDEEVYSRSVKPAQTSFGVVRYDEATDSTVVICRPTTGRTHQLRLHLQYLGHPIANDPNYGGDMWYASPGRRVIADKAQAILDGRLSRSGEMAGGKDGIAVADDAALVSDTTGVTANNGNADANRNDNGKNDSASDVSQANSTRTDPAHAVIDVPATEAEIETLISTAVQRADESDNDFIKRTCIWCARCKVGGEDRTLLEFLIRSPGIWLHALQYTFSNLKGGERSFRTQPPPWCTDVCNGEARS